MNGIGDEALEPKKGFEEEDSGANKEVKLSLGSIVELRSRLWRVDDVQGDVLVATSIDGTPIERRKFYLPFETVLPGRIEPPSSEIVGNFSAQDLLLRAYRLSMIHGAAPLMSLQRSRVVPVLFQMVPVVMSLEMPRVRLLIADDVGLGKTIEAGLTVVELFARQRASRLLVICPAMLREQWKEALDYFFHIDSEIISSSHRRTLERGLPPGTNPWEYYPYLIASMDYAKMAEVKAQVLEQNWDIILVDEAHNVAKPHQIDPKQKVKMERWELMRDLSKKTRHLIMLTATPHNGYTDTFASLLKMLEVGAVTGSDSDPVIDRDIAKLYVCQRRRSDVEAEMSKTGDKSPFPKRDADEVFVKLSPLESNVMNEVEKLGRHILATAGGEHTYRMRLAKWTVTHFHKRALSSPNSLVCSLKNRLKTVERRIEAQEERFDEETSVTEEEARAAVLDNDTGERIDDAETDARMERHVFGDKGTLFEEKGLLEQTLLEAQKVTAAKDTKLTELLDNTLRIMVRRIPKVIIFTRYRDTLDYLAKNIPEHRNFKEAKVFTLDGSLNEVQRAEKFDEFEKAPQAILVATDCVSEGINLQYVASQIIHYELPWNPNRLEQRNGRVDRYGQPKDTVFIRTMVVNDSLEAAILKVLVEKAFQIRQDFGFSPPFFGDDISVLDLIREQGYDVKIGQRSLDDFLKDMSPEPEQVINPFSDESIQRMKNDNFYGQSSIDLSEVQKRLTETENLIGSKEQIQNFVKSGLNRFGCRITGSDDDTFRIEVLDSRLSQGLEKNVLQSATFDPLRGRDDPELEVIDLGHRLVRNLIDLVKQLTFSSKESDIYGRTACIATRNATKVSAVYTFLARYAVHTDPVSIVEELLRVGFEVHGGDIFSQADVNALSCSIPVVHTRTEAEMKEDLSAALSKLNLETALRKRAEERCAELAIERGQVKKSLEGRGEQQWLEGIDNLSVASVDLLCVTVYYPALGGN
ncbi:DEAD/DEAH box helicase [Candidatus Bathyarchaeota archaeon]|nr:DEAD/DEAH box helicase [Candidatus Bathyarchaeota archaeon]